MADSINWVGVSWTWTESSILRGCSWTSLLGCQRHGLRASKKLGDHDEWILVQEFLYLTRQWNRTSYDLGYQNVSSCLRVIWLILWYVSTRLTGSRETECIRCWNGLSHPYQWITWYVPFTYIFIVECKSIDSFSFGWFPSLLFSWLTAA